MLRSYVKGALSYVLPSARNSHTNAFPVSAEFSYSQFLRHLVLRSRFNKPKFGERVAELGPGSSLGFGLAALVSGAGHYETFDIATHFDVATNLHIFDQLVGLFGQRTSIPDEGEFVRLFPFIDDKRFPSILTPKRMSAALAPDRLARIRRDIAAGGGETIRTNVAKVSVGSRFPVTRFPVDWLASHSVLEHVDDLEDTYAFLKEALAPQGVMTHLVDFSSHQLTKSWNGHWALNSRAWTILRGRRRYLINRAPLSAHISLLERNGLHAVDLRLYRRVDGLLNTAFCPQYRQISGRDASTHMAFMVCQRLQSANKETQRGVALSRAVAAEARLGRLATDSPREFTQGSGPNLVL